MKKFLKPIIVLLISIIAFLCITPIVLKPKLIQLVKDYGSKRIHGKLDFTDLDISFIRRFPQASLKISNILIQTYQASDTSDFLAIHNLELRVNVSNLLFNSENLIINGLYVDRPNLQVIQYDSLHSNYSGLIQTDSTSTDQKSVSLSIKSYSISDGQFEYYDYHNDRSLIISGLNHSGAFENSGNITISDSKTAINSLDYIESGLAFFKNVQLSSSIQLEADNNIGKYVFRSAYITLNKVTVNLDGYIRFQGDSTELGLNVQCPKTDFKDFFSIIPNAFTKDYKDVLSKGFFTLHATSSGWYHKLAKLYPSWDCNLHVTDGEIKYPGKALALSNVHFNLHTKNTNSDGSGAFVHLDTLNLAIGENYLRGHLFYNDFLSAPSYKGLLAGDFNFKDLSKFYPLEGSTQLSGSADARLNFSFSEADALNKNYSNILFDAVVHAQDIIYADAASLPVQVSELDFSANPKLFSIQRCDVAIGDSKFDVSGNVPDFLTSITSSSLLKCNLDMNASLIELNQLMSQSGNGKTDSSKIKPGSPPAIINRLDLKIKGKAKKCVYEDYSIEDISALCSFGDGSFKIQSADLLINQNRIHADGQFDNIVDFVYKDKTLIGTLNCNAPIFDVETFFNTKSNTNLSKEKTDEYMVFPSNMNLDIRVNAAKVNYKPLVLNQVNGLLHLENQVLEFHEAEATVSGGKMSLNGVLRTKESANPEFDMKYEIKSMQFRKAFQDFLTISKIAPLFNYIEGYFDGSMILKGELGKDLSPVYDKLNIEGLIETIDGTIKNFKPLVDVSQKLKLDYFKSLNIKNTKNWFTLQNGTVQIQDFKRKIDDISLDVQGSHKISGPMDYSILVVLPQSKISKYTKGIGLDEGLNHFNSLLKKAGIEKELSKNLNMLVKLKGSIANPDISIKLVPDLKDGGIGQGTDIGGSGIQDQAKDAAGKAVESVMEKAKSEVSNKAQALEDSLHKMATKNVEKVESAAKDIIEKEVIQKVDSNLGKVLKEPLDSISDKLLKGSGKKQLDSLKNKIKGWNPFKK